MLKIQHSDEIPAGVGRPHGRPILAVPEQPRTTGHGRALPAAQGDGGRADGADPGPTLLCRRARRATNAEEEGASRFARAGTSLPLLSVRLSREGPLASPRSPG